jgi:hypothetical protein
LRMRILFIYSSFIYFLFFYFFILFFFSCRCSTCLFEDVFQASDTDKFSTILQALGIFHCL